MNIFHHYLRRHIRIIVGSIIGLFVIVQGMLAESDARTFDEVAHIGAAISYWQHYDYRLNPEHPPLAKIGAGLFALPLAPQLSSTEPYWTTLTDTAEFDQWAAGRAVLFGNTERGDHITYAARLFPILLGAAVLATLFAWGRALGGIIGGLIALLLGALSPLLLGHSHYVTTDVALALSVVLTLWRFERLLAHPTRRNTILAALALGVALGAKFSSILLLPLLGIGIVLAAIRARKRAQAGQLIRCSIAAIGGALVVLYMLYAPFTWTQPRTVLDTVTPARLHHTDATTQTLRSVIHTLNTYAVTRPVATALYGIGYMRNRITYGNNTYFLGAVYDRGTPLYFPIVLLLKEPLPFLALLLLALWYAPRHIRWRRHDGITFLMIGTFILLYSATAISQPLTIGERHMLPIFPLLYVAIGAILSRAIRNAPCACPRRSVMVGTLLIVLAITIVRAYPFYLSFFNAAVGGPLNGYRYVTDSNADWGQDAKRVLTYLAQHPEITTVRVDYFGGDDLFTRLHDHSITAIPWWADRQPRPAGYYLISANTLQLSLHGTQTPREHTYAFLANETPYARIGTSLFLYYYDGSSTPPLNVSSSDDPQTNSETAHTVSRATLPSE